MKPIFFILLLFSLCFPFGYADIMITEIMANPLTDETLNEWVEIYNNGSTEIDIYGWVFGDEEGNDSLVGGYYEGSYTILRPHQFGLITNEMTRVYHNFNVSSDVIPLYTDGSLGYRGLKNDGETVFLFSQEGVVDSVYYNETDDELSWALVGSEWRESVPSPGYHNSGEIIEEENDVSACDWNISIIHDIDTYYSLGDLHLKIVAEKQYGEKTNISSHLMIKDIFGNVVEEYFPFTQHTATSRKTSSTYNPVLDEQGAYVIEASVSTACEDHVPANNAVQLLLLPAPQELQNHSSVIIERLYDLGSDNLAKYGQSIRAKIIIYKGDTRKKAVKVWVEKDGSRLSKQSQINVEEEFTNHTFTIPLQIIPNCNEKYKKGDASVVAEGLDARSELSFEIEGITSSLCEEVEVDADSKRGKLTYSIASAPYTLSLNKSFDIVLKVENTDDDDTSFEVWSYVYRGPKKYSGSERDNLKYVSIDAEDSMEVVLRNTVIEGTEGDYKLKVKLKRRGRVTSDDKTRDVVVKVPASVKEKREEVVVLGSAEVDRRGEEKKEIEAEKTERVVRVIRDSEVVYESSTFFIKKLIPFFLMFLFVLAVLFSLVRK